MGMGIQCLLIKKDVDIAGKYGVKYWNGDKILDRFADGKIDEDGNFEVSANQVGLGEEKVIVVVVDKNDVLGYALKNCEGYYGAIDHLRIKKFC